MLYSQSVERSDHSSDTDNDQLLDEAYLALGTAALYCKQTDAALQHYGLVNSAHGAYKQCEVNTILCVVLLSVYTVHVINCIVTLSIL